MGLVECADEDGGDYRVDSWDLSGLGAAAGLDQRREKDIILRNNFVHHHRRDRLVMVSPKSVDERILNRFDELITECSDLIEKMEPLAKSIQLPKRLVPVCVAEFNALAIKSTNLLHMVFDNSEGGSKSIARIDELEPCIESTQVVLGLLQGFQGDYEKGFLQRLRDVVVADVSSDYLSQAEELLKSQDQLRGDYGSHIAATAVCGAVFEHALRQICARHSIPLTYEKKGKEKHKLLDRLISDLQKNEIITVSKADQLRSWAKLRNSADHGEFAKVPPNDVKSMILGVKKFLEEMRL